MLPLLMKCMDSLPVTPVYLEDVCVSPLRGQVPVCIEIFNVSGINFTKINRLLTTPVSWKMGGQHAYFPCLSWMYPWGWSCTVSCLSWISTIICRVLLILVTRNGTQTACYPCLCWWCQPEWHPWEGDYITISLNGAGMDIANGLLL